MENMLCRSPNNRITAVDVAQDAWVRAAVSHLDSDDPPDMPPDDSYKSVLSHWEHAGESVGAPLMQQLMAEHEHHEIAAAKQNTHELMHIQGQQGAQWTCLDKEVLQESPAARMAEVEESTSSQDRHYSMRKLQEQVQALQGMVESAHAELVEKAQQICELEERLQFDERASMENEIISLSEQLTALMARAATAEAATAQAHRENCDLAYVMTTTSQRLSDENKIMAAELEVAKERVTETDRLLQVQQSIIASDSAIAAAEAVLNQKTDQVAAEGLMRERLVQTKGELSAANAWSEKLQGELNAAVATTETLQIKVSAVTLRSEKLEALLKEETAQLARAREASR